MSEQQVTIGATELANLRRIKAAALALAQSEPCMRAMLRGEFTVGRYDPWPEADALVAALKGAAR